MTPLPGTRHLYDRPIAVLAMLAALLVLGGLAIPGMRIRLLDRDNGPGKAYVSLSCRGLTTRDTIDRLTRPAEEVVRSQAGIASVQSTTSHGSLWLEVTAASASASKRLAKRLSQAFASNRQRFPREMEDPQVHSWSMESMPLLVVAINRGSLDETEFEAFIEHELITGVKAIPGVGDAAVWQLRSNQTRISLDPNRLAAQGIDSGLVTAAVAAQAAPDQSFPLPEVAGSRGGAQSVSLRKPRLSPETLALLPLAPGTALGDVATVRVRASADDFALTVDGKPGSMVFVQAAGDGNVYLTARDAGAAIARMCAARGLSMAPVFDQHRAFDEVAHEILVSAAWCALFSALFLIVFLGRWRLALLVCSALPLSLVMALIAMAVCGSQLSLLALIGFLVASGMVVDNAIVIAESLLRARHAADPLERKLVLRRATRAVAMAIVVSTLTTMALFMPVLISDAGMGREMLVGLALPIVWSLLGSLVVALVLVPMAFARLYPHGSAAAGPSARGHVRWLLATERAYGRLLTGLLLRPALGLALSSGLLGGSLLALLLLEPVPVTRLGDAREIALSPRTNPKVDYQHLVATLARWHAELAPHRVRLGIISEVGFCSQGSCQLNLYLTPIDPLDRQIDEIEDEVMQVLSSDPDVLLQGHIQLARIAVTRAEEKAAKAKAKADAEAKAKAKAEAAQAPAAASAGGSKTATGAKAEGEAHEGSQLTTLILDLSSPQADALMDAHRRLHEAIEAIGGIANDAQPERGSYGRQPKPAVDGIALALTPSAEEQGWHADQIGMQLARFNEGERPQTMPGGWQVSFGRVKDDVRTIDRLLDAEVFQAANADTAGALRRQPPRSPPAAAPPAPAAAAPAGGGRPPEAAGPAASARPAPAGSSGVALRARPAAPSASGEQVQPRALPGRPAQVDAQAPPRAGAGAQGPPAPPPPASAVLRRLVEPGSAQRERTIQRIDGLTHVQLSVVMLSSTRARIIADLPAILARARIPDDVAVTVHQQKGDDNSISELWFAIVIAAGIIYLLMCILYESLLAPLAVMTSVPAAIISVMGMFVLLRLPQDPMVILALFLLVGIVINHGVVLVDRLDTTVPMHRLASRRSLLAVAAAARRRFTPVLLTSLTTIAGAVPMAFSHGHIVGAPIASLGLALSIGLAAATVFTLLVVPIVYQWLAVGRAGMFTLLHGGRST